MAKNEALAIKVPFSSVYWFPELNSARKTKFYGDKRKLDEVQSLLTLNSWLMDSNGIIDVERISPELLTRAYAERQAKWDELVAAKAADSAKGIDLDVFVELYTNGKKLNVIEFSGISGNRRSMVVFNAMIERKRKNLELVTELPVTVYTFKNKLERLRVQLGENENKTAGFLEISIADRLLAAKEVYQEGGSEADITRIFKRGTAQKLYPIVSLDNSFPALAIVDRMCLPPEDSRFLNWNSKATNKESGIRNLAKRAKPDQLAELIMEAKIAGTDLPTAPTSDEVERFFNLAVGVKVNADKIMPKETIKNLSNQCPNNVSKRAFKGIMESNTDVFRRDILSAVAHNCVDDLVDSGDYPPVEQLLMAMVSTPTHARADMFKRLLAAVAPPSYKPTPVQAPIMQQPALAK